MNYQRLLLDHLGVVDQIVRMTGRRRHLSAAEQEDFAGFVRLRLIEDDYAVLRKFQHRSSLHTYLSAVIDRMSLDFHVERWGRWRPSATADRLGRIAVMLERLVSRDGHTLEEAMEIVRTNHGAVETYAELRRIWEQLPARTRNQEVAEEVAITVHSAQTADLNVEDAERRKNIERLERALRSAFEQIPAQDRVLLALRFDQDLSIIEISTVLGSSVGTLHRRMDKTVKQLRAALSSAGFDPRAVAGLIGHPSIAMSPLLRAEVESFLGSVRLSKQDG